MTSKAELTLEAQLDIARIGFDREVVFAPPRKYRADFRIGDLLIEIDGGGFVDGRHGRGKGMENDCEKSFLAAINGFRFARCTPDQVNDGRALRWIIEATERKAAA